MLLEYHPWTSYILKTYFNTMLEMIVIHVINIVWLMEIYNTLCETHNLLIKEHANFKTIMLFPVDFSGAGMLEQEVQIVGPSGVDVVYDTRELGHLWRDYIYEAEEPGRYQIYVRYAGFELPDK